MEEEEKEEEEGEGKEVVEEDKGEEVHIMTNYHYKLNSRSSARGLVTHHYSNRFSTLNLQTPETDRRSLGYWQDGLQIRYALFCIL